MGSGWVHRAGRILPGHKDHLVWVSVNQLPPLVLAWIWSMRTCVARADPQARGKDQNEPSLSRGLLAALLPVCGFPGDKAPVLC